MDLQKDEYGYYFVIDSRKIYRLTEHFSVDEMFTLPNSEFQNENVRDIHPSVILNLTRVCYALEVIRKFLGDTPIKVLSAYQCRKYNQRIFGGYDCGHVTGHAVDVALPVGRRLKEFFKTLTSLGILDIAIFRDDHVHLEVEFFESPNSLPLWKKSKRF